MPQNISFTSFCLIKNLSILNIDKYLDVLKIQSYLNLVKLTAMNVMNMMDDLNSIVNKIN